MLDIGANASAEEAEEAMEDAAVKVNNIVHSFRLQSTSFDKKSYLAYLKGTSTLFIRDPAHQADHPNLGYMKAVKASLQERGAPAEEITAFEKGAQGYVKNTLLANFKDFEFYTGESMNPDGMYVVLFPPLLFAMILTLITRVVLLNYREDGVTPYVIVWKHGVKETKV